MSVCLVYIWAVFWNVSVWLTVLDIFKLLMKLFTLFYINLKRFCYIIVHLLAPHSLICNWICINCENWWIINKRICVIMCMNLLYWCFWLCVCLRVCWTWPGGNWGKLVVWYERNLLKKPLSWKITSHAKLRHTHTHTRLHSPNTYGCTHPTHTHTQRIPYILTSLSKASPRCLFSTPPFQKARIFICVCVCDVLFP